METPPRTSEEQDAEDQSTNEIGFRNVDEQADHDEIGSQGESAPAPSETPED